MVDRQSMEAKTQVTKMMKVVQSLRDNLENRRQFSSLEGLVATLEALMEGRIKDWHHLQDCADEAGGDIELATRETWNEVVSAVSTLADDTVIEARVVLGLAEDAIEAREATNRWAPMRGGGPWAGPQWGYHVES